MPTEHTIQPGLLSDETQGSNASDAALAAASAPSVMATDERELQRAADRLVDREVYACVSGLVSTLANGYGFASVMTGDVVDLTERAFELASPVLDYEEAAIGEGWRKDSSGYYLSHDFDAHPAASWQDLCEAEGIEPYEREVYEHWIVSNWLAEKLEAAGEKVDTDFAGLTVWARTTTGQAISMDHVIQSIVLATGYAMGAA